MNISVWFARCVITDYDPFNQCQVVEPARVFSAKICADLGASDLQWFGSFWYGLSMPDSDIDFMPILSSSAKKDVSTFLRSLAAHLRRPECRDFGFQEVSLNQ